MIAAVQKEKAVKKVPKKVESSDDSDSESEEEEKVQLCPSLFICWFEYLI